MDIQSFIKKNKEKLMYGAVFVVLATVGIYFIVFRDDGEGSSVYEVPLEQSEDTSFEWGTLEFDTTVDSDTTSVPVYKVDSISSETATEISYLLGFVGTGQITGEGTYLFWGDDDEYVRYNTITGDLIVGSSGLRLTKIERGIVTASEIDGYVREFAREYLNVTTDMDITVESRYGNYMVDVVWNIGGYDVTFEYGQEYSMRAEFTQGGDLVSLYARPLVFQNTEESVEVVSTESLRSYLRVKSYPKEAYISVETFSEDCSFLEDCDPYGMYTSEGFSSVEIQRVTVVYYYNAVEGSSMLIPVYKLEGEGISSDEDGHPINVTIYANAIDPSRVVIPLEE